MAQIVSISPKELERVAAAAYETKSLKVMLCNVGTSNYTASSTVANWQSVEVSGNGYVRFSATIAVGSYNNTTAKYEFPQINAAFSASGDGYSYDRIVLYVDGATFPHSVIEEDPNIVLAPGQAQTYRFSLSTDD